MEIDVIVGITAAITIGIFWRLGSIRNELQESNRLKRQIVDLL